MNLVRVLVAATATAVMAATAVVVPPHASAMMVLGNYDVLTDRYTRASWYWFVAPCFPAKQPDCVAVSAAPRRKFYDYYDGQAMLVNGRYTLAVDVPDGLQCPGHVMPTRDVYSWDEVSLAGTIDSTYAVGCFNGPPGSQFWTFALRRL